VDENGPTEFEWWMNNVAYPDLYSNSQLKEWAAARDFVHPDDSSWLLYPPPDNGFSSTSVNITRLEVGRRLDRYGGPGGSYFGDPTEGIGREGRGLPDNPGQRRTEYVVLREFSVREGEIAPWFQDDGGKTQFFLGENVSVQSLLDANPPYIRVVR